MHGSSCTALLARFVMPGPDRDLMYKPDSYIPCQSCTLLERTLMMHPGAVFLSAVPVVSRRTVPSREERTWNQPAARFGSYTAAVAGRLMARKWSAIMAMNPENICENGLKRKVAEYE